MFPNTRHQKISVSGLTVDDLMHWLNNIPRCKDARLVVIHVGINTCWQNTITESCWEGLIKLLKKIFPGAQLHVSSIVPPRGNHPISKTVGVSNAALSEVCRKAGDVVFIDHTSTFTTAKGAPRKALYNNALHPSQQGTVRLACNIKYATKQGPPSPVSRSTINSGRPPLLPTPSVTPSVTTSEHGSNTSMHSARGPSGWGELVHHRREMSPQQNQESWPVSHTPLQYLQQHTKQQSTTTQSGLYAQAPEAHQYFHVQHPYPHLQRSFNGPLHLLMSPPTTSLIYNGYQYQLESLV